MHSFELCLSVCSMNCEGEGAALVRGRAIERRSFIWPCIVRACHSLLAALIVGPRRPTERPANCLPALVAPLGRLCNWKIHAASMVVATISRAIIMLPPTWFGLVSPECACLAH